MKTHRSFVKENVHLIWTYLVTGASVQSLCVYTMNIPGDRSICTVLVCLCNLHDRKYQATMRRDLFIEYLYTLNYLITYFSNQIMWLIKCYSMYFVSYFVRSDSFNIAINKKNINKIYIRNMIIDYIENYRFKWASC